MSDAEKKQLDEAEVAQAHGGKKTIELEGDEWDVFDEPNVTIYCPKCEGSEFGVNKFLFIEELKCVKCGHRFLRDLDGSASIGSNW